MRAAIDIGSNSIRLAMQDGTVRSVITKLADGLQYTGMLSPDGVTRTIEVISDFKAQAERAGADEIIAFATEAVRRAKDGNKFCEAVHSETAIEVKILSGETEAALALAGVQKPNGAVTVCDLGGGSLEVISSADGTKPDYIKSLPLGVVVLKNDYNGDYRKAIDEMPRRVAEFGEVQKRTVVLAGGSACAMAAGMLNLKVYDKAAVSTRFTTARLDDCMPIFLSPKLSVLRPVCARRADTLPYGAIIIQALLNHLGATEFYVSDSSNLEAIMNGYKL